LEWKLIGFEAHLAWKYFFRFFCPQLLLLQPNFIWWGKDGALEAPQNEFYLGEVSSRWEWEFSCSFYSRFRSAS
jgi:hypothetical protein